MNVRRKKRLGIPARKSGGYIPKYRTGPSPVPCVIRCSRCFGAAYFDEPFEFTAAKPAGSQKAIQLGGGYIVEKFPNTFPWNSPENSKRLPRAFLKEPETWGVVTCPSCAARGKHLLNWPHDAYYKTSVRGETLWAATKAEVEALRDYIANDRKFVGRARGHFWFLRHVPKHFLLVKHREEVLKKLDRLLE